MPPPDKRLPPDTRPRFDKRRLFAILEQAKPGDRASQAFDALILGLILANLAALVLESHETIRVRHETFFLWFEAASVLAFTVEYILRAWSCAADPRYRDPISGRLRYAATPLMIIDLLAILPFYVFALGHAAGLAWHPDLRALRVARLLRLGKLGRYSKAAQSLGRVLASSRDELLATLSLMIGLLFVAATLVYYAERDTQPDIFSSIPASAWWAVATLTPSATAAWCP